MKLTAVEMADVRRFAGRRVRVGPIGDGVSVLAAPNESGKSTLFDALQALVFQPHRSRGKQVMPLQPHQGGAPEVAAEIELDGQAWRIEKRWLSRPMARVLDGAGRLVAQADEAEAWIAEHVLGPAGGPSGLVWVRQGRAGLAEAGPVEARRDILARVAGEVEAMTGGRRMDAVRARLDRALAALATETGRPRAGGPWKAALDEAAALETAEADLADRAARLAEALAERRRCEAARSALAEPGAEAERRDRLAAAEAAAQAAEGHAARLREARQAEDLARAEHAAAADRRDGLRRLADEAEAAARARDAARMQQAEADRAAAEARSAAEAARGRLAAARASAAALRARLRAAEARARAQAAARRMAELAGRMENLEAALQLAAEARAARAAMPVTRERLRAAETAAAALAALEAQASAQAVALRFDYVGPARAQFQGRPVAAELRLTGPAELDLPGIGRLTVDPGARVADGLEGRLETARAALAQALEGCGAADLAAAAEAWRAAEGYEAAARDADALVAVLAPDGPEALRRDLAEATAQVAAAGPGGPAVAADADADDPAALARAVEAAETALAAAEAEAAAAEAAGSRAAAALAGAAATAAAAAARDATARAALGPEAGRAEALAVAEAAVAAARARLTEAEAARAALAGAAPDAEAVAAALARARGAVQAADEERRGLEARLAELRGQIGVLAEAGIEESLAETRDRLAAARARAAAQADRVAALTRLRAALDAARAAARDAYFAPVVQELVPLMAMVWPGATVAMDDATLLPGALLRDGVSEAPAILSGGTQEQVAVLTRLAFARLFARRGQGVPVILDDALVATDDDRIEAMFTALHRAARDLQVIVLTCRQRTAAALGGRPLRFESLAGGN